jgi:ATP-dependent DNA helicase DinG
MSGDDILKFFAEGGPLARRIPGYRMRTAQIDMALAIDESFRSPGARVVVEAGTGTGKSFAYLVPALLHGVKVAVATGTKALQDQLFTIDVPLVADAVHELTGQRRRTVLMKGRQNYLCLTRFEHFRARPLFVFAEDAQHYAAIEKWVAKTETGDRSEIDSLPDDWRTWSDIDAGADTCVGNKCAQYDACFVTKMRREAEVADLLIVNHHLLCADVRVRLEGLPESSEAPGEDMATARARVIPDTDALVIDEAHALPDVATNYFGVQFSLSRAERLAKDAARVAETLEKTGKDNATRALSLVNARLPRLFSTLTDGAPPQERVRLDRIAGVKSARPQARELVEAFTNLAQRMELQHTGGEDPVRDIETAGIARRASQMAAEVQFVLETALDDPAFVAALEREGRGLSASPVDVARALEQTLFSGARPVVLTSATLAVAGSTESFRERVGLPVDDHPQLVSMVLPSPFAFAERAALYAPKDFPEPDDERFRQAFDDEVRFLVGLAGGGTMLLFTSKRALDGAYERLGPGFIAAGLTILRQGEAPKGALLERLKAADRAEAGVTTTGAVLFATQSFWEGVDVPGRALRLVVIDRLPFRSPGDPLVEARNELAKARGFSPFTTLSLPEAALALKQGVGRLIRKESDAGVVAVLDGRLRTKRYGKLFLDTLPPLMRIGARDGLARFWELRVAPAFTDAKDAAPVDEMPTLPNLVAFMTE